MMHCGQRTFGGCKPVICDRPCPVRSYSPPPPDGREKWLWLALAGTIVALAMLGAIAIVQRAIDNTHAVNIANSEA